ncbi:MAG: amino acid adenylation domain-containing protein [Planctomycetota bacterium]|nr:amino acid adenylation domain-containing protein [Planctomycetota bacterium]
MSTGGSQYAGSVIAAFSRSAKEHAARPAVAGDRVAWTYAQLDAISTRVAHALRGRGVGRGAFVPVALGRSPEYVATVLAILKCGAAYVPVDAGDPPARRRSIVQQLDARLGVAPPASPLAADLPVVSFEELSNGADGSTIEPAGGLDPAYRLDPRAPGGGTTREDPLYVMFTSGSTGTPKGAIIPHRGVLRLVLNTDYAHFGPEQRWANLSSISFDASTLELWGALLNGGCCVMVEDHLPTLERIEEVFKSRGVTDCWLTAALFNTIVDLRPEMLRGLRQVLTGGEAASPKHVRRFLAECPTVRLIHGYGPTENTTFSLCHTIGASDIDEQGRIPIGTPIRGTTVRLVAGAGAEGSSAAEPDTPGRAGEPSTGELLVGGDGVALGYLGNPTMSAAKFVDFADGTGRWYRTGDLVTRRGDGRYVFLGRIDRQIKLRGFRIELDEIESALLAHPRVASCVVDAVGDSAETRTLVAVCAGASDADSLRDWLRSRLPAYMIPSRLVVKDQLPLGQTGKVDRRAALALLSPPGLNGKHDAMPGASEVASRGPSGHGVGIAERAGQRGGQRGGEHADNTGGGSLAPSERAIASMWRDALGQADQSQLLPEADFFEQGGHSIRAMRLVAGIARELGVRLTVGEVYQHRTLGAIASLVAQRGGLASDTVSMKEASEPAGRASGREGNDPRPCGQVQAGLLYEWTLHPSSNAYHVYAAFVLDSGSSREAIARCVSRALNATDLLRSRVVVDEGEIRWRAEEATDSVVIEAGSLEWTGAGSLPARVLAEIAAPFDLVHAPPTRAHVWDLDDGRRLLVLVIHHAVIDEWSLDLVLDAMVGPGESDLGPLSGSYDGFVEWERRSLNRAEAARRGRELAELERDQLAGERAGGRAGGPEASGAYAVEATGAIGAELAAQVESLAARERVSPFAVYLAAHGLALARREKAPHTLIATPFANRGEAGLLDVVGCMIDLRPIRIEVDRHATFASMVRSVHELILREHSSGPLPFTSIVEAFREAGGQDASFAVQNAMTYRMEPMRARRIAGLMATPVRVPARQPKFAGLVQIERNPASKGGASWDVICEARSARGDDAKPARALLDAFLRELELRCAEPDAPLRAGPVLAGAVGAGPGSDERPRAGSEARNQSARPGPPGERGFDPEATFGVVCAQFWRETLNVASVGERDDFFALGGSSLQLVKLAARLKNATGRSPDLGAFLQRPVFGELCRLLEAGENRERVGFLGDPQAEVFFAGIPGVAGTTGAFFSLWQALERALSRPVRFLTVDFAQHEVDLARADHRGERVTGLVDSIARSIEEHAHGRPIYLAGYSLGGVLALAAGAALAERGREASRVFLIDSYSIERTWPSKPMFARMIAESFVASPLKTTRHALRALRKRTTQAGMTQAGTTIAQHAPGSALSVDAGMQERAELVREIESKRVAMRQAFRAFRLPRFAGPVTLIRTAEPYVSVGRPGRANGLGRSIAGPLSTHTLKLEHLDLLRSGVGLVAEILARDVGPGGARGGS